MRWHGLVESTQKLKPLLMSMPFLTEPVHLAVGCIEGSKKSSGAVAFVVVRHGLAAPTLQWQSGLGTIQSLDLTFLVHAQHQSVFGRVQIQADDIFQFFCKLGVAAEALDALRFSPWLCQIRRTLASLMPTAAAMVRVLQCV